jgi:hypothetical protein
VTHGSTRAHLSKEVRSRAAGHVAVLEPTSTGRCGSKLQLGWQCVDARPAPCLDLELVCESTRSSGCEPAGGTNFLTPRSVILSFYSAVDGGPWEVPELEVQKLETLMADPLRGAGGRSNSGHHRS